MNRADPASTPHIGYPSRSSTQIGQARAFGVDRCTACGQRVDLLAHNLVGRQLGGELLGEPAGQHQRGGAAGQRVGQRVELDDVGAGGAQQFAVFGVAEAERLPAASATVTPLTDGVRPPTGPRRRRPPGLAAATTPARSTWRATSAVIASTAALRLAAVLDRGHQAEMP